MKIIKLEEFKKEDSINLICAIGNFDGFHLGHQKILKAMKEFLKAFQKKKLALISFNPNTRLFFHPKENFLINTFEEKVLLAKHFGFEILIEIEFNEEFKSQNPHDFIKEVLIEKLGIRALFVGEDFQFGKGKSGDIKLFAEYKDKFDFFDIMLESPENSPINQISDKKNLSSSAVRALISKNGDVLIANKLLGYNFFAMGEVVQGFKRGRLLGFPTANIEIKDGKIFPKFGVYKTSVWIFENKNEIRENFEKVMRGEIKPLKSITNFGIKPTFGDDLKPILETHILNFDEDIYGKILFISFEKFIREEKKFNSIDELKVQIQKDIEFC